MATITGHIQIGVAVAAVNSDSITQKLAIKSFWS